MLFSQPTHVQGRFALLKSTNSVLFLDLPEIDDDDGVLFMAFIRKTDDIPQAQYLTERQIEADGGNLVIAAAMREALSKHRSNNAVVFSAEL